MKNIDTLIEQYVMGNMSPEEASSFENYIAQNPEAKAEVSMQKNIFEAIKQTRRLELKTRLIQVNPNATSPVAQKIAIAFATFVTASLVGFGIYTTSIYQKEVITEVTTESKQIIKKENTKASEKTSISKNERTTDKITFKTEAEPKEVIKVENNASTKKSEAKVGLSTTPKKEFDPLKSTLSSKDEKEIANDENLPIDHHNGSIEKEEINYSIDENYDYLGYIYDGKNLQLLGEFKKGKDAYIVEKKAGLFLLKYQGNIYRIKETSKIEKLEDHLITDSNLLEALK